MIHIVLMLLCFAVASAQVHKKGMTMKLTIDGLLKSGSSVKVEIGIE